MDQEILNKLSGPILVNLPPLFAINQRWKKSKSVIHQLLQPDYRLETTITPYQEKRVIGYTLTPVKNTDEPLLVIVNSARPPGGYKKILRANPILFDGQMNPALDLSTARWLQHPDLPKRPSAPIDYPKIINKTIRSWDDAFSYQGENLARHVPGLRPPQIGAIHAIHAHWTVSDQAATVVMPTGTGKTETMLSILVSAQCSKILVVVPTDALRTQIAEKFLTLGILKEIGVISNTASYPIVGILKHQPKDCQEIDDFFAMCQVVVTTMSIVGRCGIGKATREAQVAGNTTGGEGRGEVVDKSQWREEIQERMSDHCPYLFVDEAHHIAATTWSNFVTRFGSRRVLQFTATPFRNDEKPIGGKIIFNYPMRKAQEEGYFRPIQFLPVEEFNPKLADEAIASKAVEQLKADEADGHKHVLMARVESIDRAKKVFKVYEQYGEFNPVQIHSDMTVLKKKKTRQQILDGTAKIIVCVDMLGEGFDLPSLKIAAFHDVRKSLAITLQLAGRFTRSKTDLGEPTFIANIADIRVQQKLSRLYSQDADWNALLRRSSEFEIQEQVDLYDFIEGFNNLPKELPLQNIRPPKNVIIYQTECQDWTPEYFVDGLQGVGSLEQLHHDVNAERDTLIIVLARKVPVDWARIEDIYNWQWELYVLHWDKSQDLLFIAGSHSGGFCKKLAEAVAGFSFDISLAYADDLDQEACSPRLRQAFESQDISLSSGKTIKVEVEEEGALWWISDKERERSYQVTRKADVLRIHGTVWPIRGQPVFRSLHGIRRLILYNLGLTKPLNRFIRFVMRAGSNVVAGLTPDDTRNAYESNMSGGGFNVDERTSVGCSRRGKIWSQGAVNLHQLTEWAQTIGTKVLDPSITLDHILEGTLKPRIIHSRPLKMPITIEWPEVFIQDLETATRFTFPAKPPFEIQLEPIDDLISGPITDNLRHAFGSEQIIFSKEAKIYSKVDGKEWEILDPNKDLVYKLVASHQSTDVFTVLRPKVTEHLSHMDIQLREPTIKGKLLFDVFSDDDCATYEQTFLGGLHYRHVSGPVITVRRGYTQDDLTDFFEGSSPIIRFDDGSFLEGNVYIPLEIQFEPYPIKKIDAWHWAGTDIKSESQGAEKKTTSIQFRVIQDLKDKEYDLIFDDDGSGEAADVVAVRIDKKLRKILVDFYHLKYSGGGTAGARITDLYEVCGQAQKSIHWKEKKTELFQHLRRRELRKRGGVSRIDEGDNDILQILIEMSKVRPVDFKIYIVQPGMAKTKVSTDQLRLLAVTEDYLMETYQIPFGVIGSSYLCKVDLGFEKDLISATLSDVFIQALAKNKISLSSNYTVNRWEKAEIWAIKDKETRTNLLVEKTEEHLNVFEVVSS